jgi:hypothetical protein
MDKITNAEPQAPGRSGTAGQADGPVAGQSGGGAYPNPHTGKKGGAQEGWMGHGGQTDMAYHGSGRLGDKETGGNANAPAGKSGVPGTADPNARKG